MVEKTNTIVITGASGGIGEAACLHFLNLNFNVIGISRSVKIINDPKYKFVKCDITNENQLNDAILEVAKSLKISALINCAGITRPEKNLQSLAIFKQTFEVNLFGIYRVILELLPYFDKKNGASIINISSIGGMLGFPDNPAYGSSKAALINLSKSLAVDFSKYGIRVNSVSPGYFRTDMTRNSYANIEMRKSRENQTILGRYGEVNELMGILEFLVSEKSSYVTGQNFAIDGGWTAKGLSM